MGTSARATDSSVGGGRAAKIGRDRSSAISTTGTVAWRSIPVLPPQLIEEARLVKTAHEAAGEIR